MSEGQNERLNTQLVLKSVPDGLTEITDFETREVEIPSLENGQVLVESHFVGVDAALRLIVRDSDEFLFRVKPGDIVHGTVAGKVIDSKDENVKVGDYVLIGNGIQQYTICNGSEVEVVDVSQAPLGAWLGGFGVSGLTAYFSIFSECKPQPGQTVLINGAAGAVGSIAGQLCKLAGARVIGLTSSKSKCDWLVNELGYDVAINYNESGWFETLVSSAPDRLDIIFDNTGGQLLDQPLKLIGMKGTVLLCGSTSQYSEEQMSGPSNYIWLGTMRARMQGFVIFDYEEEYPQARARMSEWVKNGSLKLPLHEVEGEIADFPKVFRGLYEGENLGKMLLKLK